jgi:hypothetical protein
MPVYFIQAGADGLVKIGYAKNVQRRMSHLQVATPQRLRLLRTIEGDRTTEAAAHRHFASQRVAGEWFGFAPEMMTAAFPDRAKSGTPGSRLVRQIAREQGIPEDTIKKMGRRGLPHKFRLPIYSAAQQRGVTLTDADFGGAAA